MAKFSLAPIDKVFEKFAFKPKGVIHVGAYMGDEIEEYLAFGFKTILLLEANPDYIPHLLKKSDGHPSVFIANVAASDHNGTVTFKVANNGQSSSLLPLKKHADIYPGIIQNQDISVPCSTIDQVIQNFGLEMSQFNFLNMDIQGAELLALKGATYALHHIEIINSEVSFDELYEGQPLTRDLDIYLRPLGFNREAIATPFHPTWGDAIYVNRPAVTMSTLGKNGRFGNQFFQYLFIRLVSETQRLVLQTPDWIGRSLFGIEDTLLDASFPIIRQEADSVAPGPLARSYLDANKPIQTNTDFFGFFQMHSATLFRHRDLIRKIFRINASLESELRRVVAGLLPQDKKLIAIHLRRGDYDSNYFYQAPCQWYERYLSDLGLNPAEHIIYVASESPERYANRFSGYEVKGTFCIAGLNPTMAYFLDFYVMQQADTLLISNSTFSFAAALLNPRATRFARPDAFAEKLVAFNPWDSDPLDCRQVSLELHQRLRDID